jgi:hypothetical protein
LQISLYSYLIGSFFSGNAYYVTLYILFALTVILQGLCGLEYFDKPQRFHIKDLAYIGMFEVGIVAMIHVFVRTGH